MAPEQLCGAKADRRMDIYALGVLRVISRTSVMQYREKRKPLPEIARELQVDAVIEGSVLRVGKRVRITTQLIRAVPEEHLWADNYKAKAAALKALELDDHLAEAHAALGVALLYFDWNWSAAEKEFQRAIDLNPGMTMLKTNPDWDPLRSDPRFQDLLRRMKFPE